LAVAALPPWHRAQASGRKYDLTGWPPLLLASSPPSKVAFRWSVRLPPAAAFSKTSQKSASRPVGTVCGTRMTWLLAEHRDGIRLHGPNGSLPTSTRGWNTLKSR